jgi:hypothetical protein
VSPQVHGAPLGADDIAQLKAKLGLDPAQSFFVPETVRGQLLPEHFNHVVLSLMTGAQPVDAGVCVCVCVCVCRPWATCVLLGIVVRSWSGIGMRHWRATLQRTQTRSFPSLLAVSHAAYTSLHII